MKTGTRHQVLGNGKIFFSFADEESSLDFARPNSRLKPRREDLRVLPVTLGKYQVHL